MGTTGFIDLFVQDNPQVNRPHYKGYIKLNGEKLEFAAWPNKNGKPGVFAGKVKPAQDRQSSAPAQPDSDGDPEVPF